MARRTPMSRQHGEPLADGRSTSRAHPDDAHAPGRRERRPDPVPSETAAHGARPQGGHGRRGRRPATVGVSETDGQLWFG